MKRRTFLRTGTAGVAAATLPRISIAQPTDTRVLRFVPQANLTVLDPIFTTAAVTANHAWMVYDTLFGVNAAQQPKPQMAEGYTVSDDGRTYLIKLRAGLKWHDGEPVRAQDCAPSLARWSARDTFGQTVAKVVDAWGVADDTTVKITLKKPFPLLIDAMRRRSNCFMMPERLAKTDPFKAITEAVGSGPFRFLKDEFVAGSSAAWQKFDGYVPRQEPAEWSSGGKFANFQRIEWKIIPDAATAAAALQNGEVDWYEQVQADLVPLLRRNGDVVIAPSNPQGYIGGIRFNHLHPPFNDVRLRRAVLTAVNQEDYMRAIMGNDHSAWRLCRSQYPCGTTYGTEVDLPVQKGDLEAAKKMIKEAGYNGQKAVIINPDRLPHDRSAWRYHLRHAPEDRDQRRTAGDRLGFGGAATGNQGTGGERRLVDLPHLVHRRLHPQPGGHGAVPGPRRHGLVRLVRQSEDRATDAGLAGRQGPRRTQEDRRGDPARELYAGAVGHPWPVPDSHCVSQEPGGQAGINRAAVLERQARVAPAGAVRIVTRDRTNAATPRHGESRSVDLGVNRGFPFHVNQPRLFASPESRQCGHWCR